MIGRLVWCDTEKPWIGRVVAVHYNDGYVVPEDERHFAHYTQGRWIVLIEDEDGKLYNPDLSALRLLPPDSTAALGFVDESGNGSAGEGE